MRIAMPLVWLLALFLGLQSCGDIAPPPAKVERGAHCLDEAFLGKLEFQEPLIQRVTENIPLTGSVETNPDKVVHFTSLVGGIIANTYFSLGDKVTKGEVLADLSSTELGSLQTERRNLESRIGVARKKLESVRAMFEDGISSQKELMEAQSELDVLLSENQKVTAHLRLFSASPEKGVFQIRAPASGVITAKSIAAGTPVSGGGEPLFTISDLSEVWVMVNVYATNVRNIGEGMEVSIRTLSYPGEIFKGQITAISQIYDNEARVLKARVVLPNTSLKLKPGMLVDVAALKHQKTEALSIPTKAVVFDDNQHFVVVYKSPCKQEIRKVEILARNNETTFLSAGLGQGEQVICKNQLLVYEHVRNLPD
jgi:cobalt-zinc-cadmium efflux system membrane fusion protein